MKTFSKLRSSIGGIYLWRAKNTKSAAEKKLMTAEADYAFRQAFALFPSPESVYRYIDLLLLEKRTDDALRIAITAKAVVPDEKTLDDLISRLRDNKPITP